MSKHIDLVTKLKAGETVTYKEFGNSMSPKLKSGVLVTLEPCYLDDLRVGDIVLCEVKGRFCLHYVRARGQDGRLLIGNGRGKLNGWTHRVYGKLVEFKNPRSVFQRV